MPGDTADAGAEDGHEPAGRERADHLVVVILERGRRDADERALLAQDRAVERLQLRPGLDPELLDERPPRIVVGGERLGLAAAPVEREHQVRAQPLAQRVRADERLDLGHELGVRAQLEVGGDPLLEHAEAQILEPVDLGLRERLQLHVGQRRPAPERERLAEEQRPVPPAQPHRASRTSRSKRAEIELVAVELEHVPGRPRLQQSGPEQLAQLRDGVLERGRRRPRRVLAPELVDEALRRDRLVRAQEQQRQQRALIPAAERHRQPPSSTSRGPRILNSSIPWL